MKVIEISKNQNPELKDKYKKEFFEVLYNAYNVHKAGDVYMVLNPKDPYKDLCKDKYIWELALDDTEKILAGILYKGTDEPGKEDRKYSLMAARMPKDPSLRVTFEAKEALLFLLKNDIENEDRHAWGEISGAVEHFYLDKMKGQALDVEDAQIIMGFKDKTVTPTDDGKHFIREIGFGRHQKSMTKVLVGSISLESAQKLKTYKTIELRTDCSKLDFETKKEITINLLIARDFENPSDARYYIESLNDRIRPFVKEIYEDELKKEIQEYNIENEEKYTVEFINNDFAYEIDNKTEK